MIFTVVDGMTYCRRGFFLGLLLPCRLTARWRLGWTPPFFSVSVLVTRIAGTNKKPIVKFDDEAKKLTIVFTFNHVTAEDYFGKVPDVNKSFERTALSYFDQVPRPQLKYKIHLPVRVKPYVRGTDKCWNKDATRLNHMIYHLEEWEENAEKEDNSEDDWSS